VRVEPANGMEIDGFLLQKLVHQGNMAALWSVSFPGETLPLLMKIPALRYGDDPAAIVGFEVEQMIMPLLRGTHVPRFVRSGELARQPYIVMERIGGASLRARLDEAPLPGDEVAAIGAEIATALDSLHSQHVIHFDIKPSNVMFRASGEAVLVDFGLSRHADVPDLLAEQFRLPLGTGPYISPEQISGVRDDPRSDLFALGVLLYHLATAVRPFGNPHSLPAVRRRLFRDPMPPRALNASMPPWLQEVILRCLEVNPAARFQSASELALELRHPDRVALTARGERTSRDGIGTVARRWLSMVRTRHQSLTRSQRSATRVIMVALDLVQGSASLAQALRNEAARAMRNDPVARLACVTVIRTPRIAMDFGVDAEGRNLQVKHLTALQRWAGPLGLPESRVSYHALEAADPAAAIIKFAGANRVDHIIIGSRGSSTLRRYLGSVSSAVVAQAECTTTVVKAGDAV
jgi:nucleotide-binding universal stress UspA family protein